MRPRATTQQERALVAQIVTANPALAAQPTEVCRLAGIDPARKGTVYAWIKSLSVDPEAVQQARVEGAVQVQKAAAGHLANMAHRLYALADMAIGKVDVAIADPDELPDGRRSEPHDRDGAAWVRSLVGVMAQAIDKAQLLSGKPTERSEVVSADDARRRLAGRLDELAARRSAKAAAG